jgi:hypothetical protein
VFGVVCDGGEVTEGVVDVVLAVMVILLLVLALVVDEAVGLYGVIF